ncbi:ComEA family DNA-binding protein [Abyssalbus ytuae]|uniref:Helix-hairpin-helix domain-containing protein n=1 Tax=Abyssalbus ytuae TaxID=2926907 RepID=A0A9E6ZJQ5_9FLAO|nr:helix-hairpin-helix domain-containing protein [Abyssalbus ytuae]UOB16862.1 helix-hairpin-helix domain-containing protein [Abyssalbus ytuae]
MNNIKSHFRFSKNQRNGIFFLLLLIFILQCIYFFVDFSSDKNFFDNNEVLLGFQKQIDSLKKLEEEKKKLKIFPFNPNYIDDHKGYMLGMSNEQIDKLLNYRKEGNYINSPQEFQFVTGVPDSLLNVFSAYFVFPKRKKTTGYNKEKAFVIKKKDINLVTVDDLKKVSGVGNKLSNRIIKYRELLGGFMLPEQLYEVYGLDKKIADKVLKHYPLITPPVIKKIEVNSASLKELSSNVYINYDLATHIIEYRSRVGKIMSFEELKKMEGISAEKINRIKLYLDFN